MRSTARPRDERALREVRRAFARRRRPARRVGSRRTMTEPSVAVGRRAGQPTCAITGELDMAGVDKVLASLPTPAAGQRLVVDLSRLAFMDSAGVHLLFDLAERARGAGWTLVVVRPGTGAVRRVLDLCRAEWRMTLVDAAPDGPAAA